MEQNELFEATLNYQAKRSQILNQKQIVNVKNTQATENAKIFVQKAQELQKQRENFNKICEEFEKIQVQNSSQEISQRTDNLEKNFQNLQQLVEQSIKNAKLLCDKKRELEKELKTLENEETVFTKFRKDLKQIYKTFGIIAQFSEELNTNKNLKKTEQILEETNPQNYHKPKKIDQNKLQKFFTNGVVHNVSIDLLETLEINISGVVRVKKLYIQGFQNTNISSPQYLHIKLQEYNSQIFFEDCEFDSIGIMIQGKQTPFEEIGQLQKPFTDKINKKLVNNVELEKIFIKNAPEHGINILSCNSCSLDNVNIYATQNNAIKLQGLHQAEIKNITIKKAQNYGIRSLYSKFCSIEQGTTQETKMDGIYLSHQKNSNIREITILISKNSGIQFQNSNCEIRSCVISNCQQYGIIVGFDSRVTEQDITFLNNRSGNTYRKYSTEL